MHRDRWSSKHVFILAAIGSAVGLGNIWRFPYLTYKYGGGAFLLPFLLILFIVGIPVLILEFALGQKMQRGMIDALDNVRKGFGAIGIGAVLIVFTITAYYVVIIAWSLIFFIYSFAMKWKGNSETFFYSDVLNLSSSVNEIGGVNWKILIALLAVWVVIYFCIWKGVNSVNKVIKPLIFIPAVCLVILLIRAVTLDGAVVGILYYIKPDFRALLDPAIWVAAIAQSFFTLSVASGAMIAYASYKPKKSDITKCAYVTAIADASISILAGFVVFGILGYMATVKGVTVSSVIKSGPGLAFVAFPEALSLMPWAVFFSLVFFLTLIAVGIASAFSLVQSIDTAILDDHSKWLKQNVSLVVCIAGFVMGIIFTTGAGMYFLDIVDHFAAEYGLLIIGLLECIIIGWFFGTEKLRQYINDVSDWKITKFWLFSIRYIIPIACTILIVRQVIQEVISPYGGYPLWALSIGWGVILFAFVCSVGFYFYDRRKRNK